MLIQLPILYALYGVIRNIPAYVDSVYTMYEPIANGILSFADGMNQSNTLISELGLRVAQFTDDRLLSIRSLICSII